MSTTTAVAAALAHRPANDQRPQGDQGIRNALLNRVRDAYAKQSELMLPLMDTDHMSLPQLRALPVEGTAMEIANGVAWESGARTGGTIGDLMDIFGIGRQQLTTLLVGDDRGKLTAGMVADRVYNLLT